MDTQTPHPPRSPRDYAAAILAEPSRERRNALLEACPAEWRDLVREHVQAAFAKVKAYRDHKAGRAQLARQKPPAAPRRDALHKPSNYTRSAPEVGNAHLSALRAAVAHPQGTPHA
ncbi:hypothetical protein [Ectopseudomonas oleovorans]|uniref:Uncharacterized protein n=1 Tax=Ectopseudomonas oleovorans (strain CECT 5344) TaxID=1182590 RepID=W6QZZ8_ECTO5|nr:hypothetical protein [Pseudomonas oleovorans]CDM42405.1 hypothetical protein BN5_3863 [Pseudomonas oleovorans CECT 5344]CDR93028.1 hypothetical protein PPSAL_3804 [Pseudomonas oleovorans]